MKTAHKKLIARTKKCIPLLLTLIAVLVVFPENSYAQDRLQDQKANLKILYVGEDPNKPLSKSEMDRARDPERALRLKNRRTPDFEQFLNQYFETVAVVYGDNYKEAMSAGYDVTIIDTKWQYKVIDEVVDSVTGRIISNKRKQYLTENYDHATLMIGHPSAKIGKGRELHIDHLCLCLDAHAHGMKLEHPIFNTPHKVEISYEEKATPLNYLARYTGKDLGDTMLMWRIQTEGYKEGKGFPIGLVSSAHKFDNGVDAEWISGGYNSKGVKATAIGRHANFLHWGFAAAPEYMTQSAKLAFINAIHYIATFKGAQQITRNIKNMPIRGLEREKQWRMSDQGGNAWLHFLNNDNTSRRVEQAKIRAKKEAGKSLTEPEKFILNVTYEDRTRESILTTEPEWRKEAFGTDYAAYEQFYKENMDYLYPIQVKWYYQTDVDKDAKALGIPNHSVKLLDKAVALLKENGDNEMAMRILTRYTDETFETASEWENWLKLHRKRLFFSEGDGYKFLVLPD